ncbi:MAG: zf-HC2 domain-containing protein [Candidatus Ratteibacteria bacterium]|nr:zf-HC2 domain-containing protein [Candidatus Ratteibacteria bacterium]
MDCRKVEKLLSRYLDNSLNESSLDEVKSHLDSCEKCMTEFNAMVKIDGLVKLKAKETPSKEYFENYWRRLEDKIDNGHIYSLSEQKRLFSPFLARFAFNSILAALLIFLGGLLYIHSQQIKSLQFVQEETHKTMTRYLAHLRTKIDMKEGIQSSVQPFDKIEKAAIMQLKYQQSKDI